LSHGCWLEFSLAKGLVQFSFLDITPSSACMVDIETVHIEYRTSELYCDYLMGSIISEKLNAWAK